MHHPTKTHTICHSPVHKETSQWPPAGLLTGKFWHVTVDCHGVRRNEQTVAEWTCIHWRTKHLAERIQLYEVFMM